MVKALDCESGSGSTSSRNFSSSRVHFCSQMFTLSSFSKGMLNGHSPGHKAKEVPLTL